MAIQELEKMCELQENCHYNTSLGEMYFKQGNKKTARSFFEKALTQTSSNAEKKLIEKKIEMCVM